VFPEGIIGGLCNRDEMITGILRQCYLLNIGLTWTYEKGKRK